MGFLHCGKEVSCGVSQVCLSFPSPSSRTYGLGWVNAPHANALDHYGFVPDAFLPSFLLVKG